jgi:flagellar hook-associated protein 1 FlgK
MTGTFFGIEIAKRAMQANQRALNITGHNIANMSTAGYTRQEAVFGASLPITDSVLTQSGTPAALGSGVDLADIRRVRDGYLDSQARDNLSEIGYLQALQGALNRVESVFPETTDNSLQNLIGNFFASWSDLSQNPDSLAVKRTVRDAADALAGGIRLAYASLGNIDQDLQDTLLNSQTGQIRQINDLTTHLAKLNQDIVKATSIGATSSDLLDQRDQLLEKLAGLMKVAVTQEQDGSVTVIAGEKVLVDGPGGQSNALVEDDLGSLIPDPGGAVGALIDARTKIAGYQAGLNELAEALTREVNDLNGLDNGGVGLFKAGEESPASDLNLSDEVRSDSTYVNGRESLNIAMLREKLTISGGSETFESFYQGELIADIAASARNAEDGLTARKAVREQLDSLRGSISGVSLDEEITKMMQYEYAYSAAARVIQVIDDMLATLLHMVD